MCAALFAFIAVEAWIWALALFALASFTDWLDGFLARVLNAGSVLGRVLDPLVDKVLITGAFIFLLPIGMRDGWLMPWMVVVVTAREFLITGLRGYLESRGVAFGADWLGKLKMMLQCAAVAIALLSELVRGWAPIRDAMMIGMVIATIVSGLQYVWRAASVRPTT